MKTFFFSVLLTLTFNLNLSAASIQISNSKNSILDGSYEQTQIVLGAVSYTKKSADRLITISRFKLDQNGNEVLVWMIADSKGNEYFAINSESDLPPAFGWDVARSGRKSNPEFDLTFEFSATKYVFKNDVKTQANIFPNPTSGLLNIETDGTITKINLYNSVGSLVSSTTEKIIDLSNLKNDVYTIEIVSDGNRIAKKVVKQ
ncbi:MAG: hypothetical protein RLZZ546_2314 [Bacteroidota bacterium]|jgi:hypothetical protein